jgi:hypothetical protein
MVASGIFKMFKQQHSAYTWMSRTAEINKKECPFSSVPLNSIPDKDIWHRPPGCVSYGVAVLVLQPLLHIGVAGVIIEIL